MSQQHATLISDAARTRDRALDLHDRLTCFLRAEEPSAWLSLDLTMPQLKVLLFVSNLGCATAGQLARALGVGQSTITGIVDRLAEHRLVTRSEDPSDRRTTRVQPTEEGQALVERIEQSRRERFRRLLTNMSADELTAVERALSALVSAAERRTLEEHSR